MADLTAEQIAELDRLEREATPGPWVVGELDRRCVTRGDGSRVVADVIDWRDTEDAALIAAARNALRSLLDEREALRRERDEARTATNFNREQYRIAFDRVQALEAARPDARDEGCPECGRMLTQDEAREAVRRYAFRPGLTNNPAGWAALITGECRSCESGRGTDARDECPACHGRRDVIDLGSGFWSQGSDGRAAWVVCRECNGTGRAALARLDGGGAMSKRKPVLPALSNLVNAWADEGDASKREVAELRAAEAALRAFEQLLNALPNDAIDRGQADYAFRALARLARVTGRDEP